MAATPTPRRKTPDQEVLAALHRARNHAELLPATEALAKRLLDQGVELHDAIEAVERARKASGRAQAAATRAARERDEAISERDALQARLDDVTRTVETLSEELSALRRLRDTKDSVERQRLELSGAYMDLAAFVEHAENLAAEIQRRIHAT